jgi:hypothetical protein
MYSYPYFGLLGMYFDVVEKVKKTWSFRRRRLGARPAQVIVDNRTKLYRRGAIYCE